MEAVCRRIGSASLNQQYTQVLMVDSTSSEAGREYHQAHGDPPGRCRIDIPPAVPYK